MPYSLDTIQSTLKREYGISIGKPALKVKLEMPQFTPDMDRMVAVANNPDNLATSGRYGVFTTMVSGTYQLANGTTWRHARYLTADEISKCF